MGKYNWLLNTLLIQFLFLFFEKITVWGNKMGIGILREKFVITGLYKSIGPEERAQY